MEDQHISIFYIGGQRTEWRQGYGGGEPVYRSVHQQAGFEKEQRVPWEIMQQLMDDLHRLPYRAER